MYSELRQFLILHQELPLPGLGMMFIERRPAQFDIANRQILPPSYQIGFRNEQVQASRPLYQWLSGGLGISEKDAIVKFNDFIFELKERLNTGEKLQWSGLGQLKKGVGGLFHFIPEEETITEGEPVVADKVLREQATHNVQVGNDQRTSEQMREFLQEQPAGRNLGFIIGIVLLVIAVLLLGLHIYSNGFSTSSSGNSQKIKLESAPTPPAYLQ